MTTSIRDAGPGDIDILVDLMADFYAEAGYELDRVHAGAAFDSLIGNPSQGRVWLVLDDCHDVVGYLVLTLTFSMEYGGPAAFLDDLYVRPNNRGAGHGREVVEHMKRFATTIGIRAIHLEVGEGNDPAQALYRRAGFEPSHRQLLTLRLADPTHVE